RRAASNDKQSDRGQQRRANDHWSVTSERPMHVDDPFWLSNRAVRRRSAQLPRSPHGDATPPDCSYTNRAASASPVRGLRAAHNDAPPGGRSRLAAGGRVSPRLTCLADLATLGE